MHEAKCMRQRNEWAALLHENFPRVVVHEVILVGYGAPSYELNHLCH